MMRTHKITFFLLWAGLSSTSFAEPELSGEMMANTCAGCHGTYGHLYNEVLPSLAGMSEKNFITAMKNFKDGTRPATIMNRVAESYTDKEIELMAKFYVAQEFKGNK